MHIYLDVVQVIKQTSSSYGMQYLHLYVFGLMCYIYVFMWIKEKAIKYED